MLKWWLFEISKTDIILDCGLYNIFLVLMIVTTQLDLILVWSEELTGWSTPYNDHTFTGQPAKMIYCMQLFFDPPCMEHTMLSL